MSAPYYAIENKAELAVKALLDTLNLDGVPVWVGNANNDEEVDGEQGIKVPRIVISAQPAEQRFKGEPVGIYDLTVEVEIFSHKHDEPEAAHFLRVANVRDKLLTDTLADDLSAAVSDFACLHVLDSTLASESQTDHYRSTIGVQMVCTMSEV